MDDAAMKRLLETDPDTISDAELRRLLVRAGLVKPGESLSHSDLETWRVTISMSREDNEFLSPEEKKFPYTDEEMMGFAIGFHGGIDKEMIYSAAAGKGFLDANPDADVNELIGFEIGLNKGMKLWKK